MQIQEVLRQLDELFATNQIQEAEQFLTEALMRAKEEERQKKKQWGRGADPVKMN